MKKRFIILAAVSAAIMLLIPLFLILFVRENLGIGIILPLFFIINPVWSAALGILSRRHPLLPLLNAVLFIVGTWCFFDFGETAFLLYAAFYLAIGWIIQLIACMIRKYLHKKKETA